MWTGKRLAEHRTLPEGATEEQLADEWATPLRVLSPVGEVSPDGATFTLIAGR